MLQVCTGYLLQFSSFYSARNARIASAVLATATPSVRPSVRLSVCLSSKSRLKLAARCPVSGCWPSC